MKKQDKIIDSLENFTEFAFGANRNLNQIIRFNTRQKTFTETVSSHIFYVAFYSMILADILQEHGYKVNVEKVLKKALLHDLEETTSGDVVRTFKIKMKKAYQKMAKISTSFVLEHLPTTLRNKYLKIWEDDSADLENQIVEIADELTGVLYCAEQIKMSNKFFEHILEGYCKNLEKATRDTPLRFLHNHVVAFLRTHHIKDYDNY